MTRQKLLGLSSIAGIYIWKSLGNKNRYNRIACETVLVKKLTFFLLVFSSLYAERPVNLFSVSSGIFDLMREKHRTWELSVEYKMHPAWLKSPFRFMEFRPLLGLMGTIEGSSYLYAGINFDLFLTERFLIAPGFAAGWYRAGGGKDLGYPLEFRSGVEIAWQFKDASRVGIHFYHLSNASLGKRNPGEESLVIFYDIPISFLFSFSK